MTEARKAIGPARPARSARQRARAARAVVLAAARERERRIEDALTVAFDRLGSLVEAQLAVEAADRELAGAVAALAELEEGPQAIAAAMELPVKEIQRLLKLAEESPAGEDAGTAAGGRAGERRRGAGGRLGLTPGGVAVEGPAAAARRVRRRAVLVARGEELVVLAMDRGAWDRTGTVGSRCASPAAAGSGWSPRTRSRRCSSSASCRRG